MAGTSKQLQLRKLAWRLRKTAKQRVGGLLPRWSVRGEITSLGDVADVWPPVLSVFPEPFVFRPPENLRPLFDSNPLYASRPIVLAPVALHEVRDGLLAPRSGLIGTSNGEWIRESCKDGLALRRYEGFETLRTSAPELELDGWVSTVMNGPQQASFGHWVLDALPRLHALGALDEPVKLIVPATLRPTYRRFLELVCPANVTIVESNRIAPVRVRRLLLSPCTTLGGCGLMRPQVIDFMCKEAVSKSTASPSPLKRIYVSRERTQWSRVANEDAVIAAMTRLGITSVVTELLSADEQVALFQGAELIVAPLGSGLANLVFARPGTTVVEIFAGGPTFGQRPHLYNAALAAGAGHRYIPVFHTNESSEPAYRVDVDRIVSAVTSNDW